LPPQAPPHSVSPSLGLSVSPDPTPPTPFPEQANLDPDSLTAELTTRLRALDNPAPETVRDTIWGGLSMPLWRTPKHSLDLSARIAAGPLCAPARRDTPPTVEQVNTTKSTAVRRLRWPDAALLLHLEYHDGEGRHRPRHWTLANITNDTG
jgi:hypothetical protein